MRVRLRKLLHRLRDDSGQSLIVVVSSMTVLLAMASFGIDTATWMVRHHHDQVVADAAALAAAQCLANPGQAGSNVTINGTVTTVPSCTSGTDTHDATTVAIDYAAANGLTITSSQVSYDVSNGHVTVNASNDSQSIFARLFGIDKTTQSANSMAGWSTKEQQCTTAGENCDFMFANSNNCSTGSQMLIVSTQGKSTINGNIQTNGSLLASATGSAGGINGVGTFGPPPCTSSTGGNQEPWNTSQPTPESSTISWPIDYSKDFPACYPAGSTPVTGEQACIASGQYAGYPTWCTNASQDITLDDSSLTDTPVSGQIYCASGTSTNLGDPSTWNGAIDISLGAKNNTLYDSFVGGTIAYNVNSGNGKSTISACGYTPNGYSATECAGTTTSPPAPPASPNYPIFYAIDQDPNPSACTAAAAGAASTNPPVCAFTMTSVGNLTLYGDTFVENGTASINLQGNQTSNMFLEANVINAAFEGDFNGDGPVTSSTNGPPSGGTEVLLQ
jgi:hypothetical protein